MNLAEYLKTILKSVILRQQSCRRNPVHKTILYSLLLIVLTSFSLSNGMEEQITISRPMIIEDYYGSVFSIPSPKASKCELLKNSLNFENIDSVGGSKREYFDFGFDDVWDQLFNNRFLGKNEPKADISFFQQKTANIPLSKETLETALQCIDQPKLCKSLSKANIRAVFTAVNFLSPSKEKITKKLAQRMKTVVPAEELDKDNEIDRIVLFKLYERSVGKVLAENPNLKKLQHCEDPHLCPYVADLSAHQKRPKINLSHQRLENIQGINHLKIDRKAKFLCLNLSHNELYEIDIEELLNEYPNLYSIKASNNKIKKVILPKNGVKKNIKIDLSNNQIEELPVFFLNNGCVLDLTDNPLSKTARQNSKKARRSTFLLRNKYWLLGGIGEFIKYGIIDGLKPSVTTSGIIIIPSILIAQSAAYYADKKLLLNKDLWKFYGVCSAGIFIINLGLWMPLSLLSSFVNCYFNSYYTLPEVYLPLQQKKDSESLNSH